MRPIRRFQIFSLFTIVAAAISGCGDVEWNWDNSFWQRPGRVVKPADSRPSQDGSDSGRPPSAANSSLAPSKDEPPQVESSSTPSNAKTPPSQAADRPAPTGVARSASGSATRPFYNLYFVTSENASTEPPRNEVRVRLGQAHPQSAARLMEMLYVPLGRSGSNQEAYLIFEQRDEFDRAVQFAPLLDIAVQKNDGHSDAAPADAWQQAIGDFYAITESGAVVDKAQVARCEREFSTITLGDTLTSTQRWAAGIFAGRLAATYRYDFEGARGHYAAARRHVRQESIEEMTSYWWRADTFIQEGKTRDANEAYEEILDAYTHLWPRSNIIARSYAIMKKNKR